MVQRNLVIMFMLSSFFSSISYAGHTNLSMKEAVRLAYENNIDLQAARSQLDVVLQEKNIARSNFFPRLDIQQSVVNTDQQVSSFGITLNQGQIEQADFNPDLLNDPDSITDYGTSLVISQPIFNGGKELLSYKMSKSGIKKATAETKAVEEKILFSTVRAYMSATLAREGLTVAEEALATAQKNLEMIQQRYDQGMIIKSDFLQAQVHLANIKDKAVRARNNLRLSLVNLNIILGQPDGNYFPSDDLDGGGCPPVDLKTLTNWAIQDRPELISLNAQGEIAYDQIRMAQSSYLPNINAKGTYEYHGDQMLNGGSDSMTLALVVNLNLFNGTQDYFKVKQAKSQLAVIEKAKTSMTNMISFEVEKAFLELESAQQRLSVTSGAVNQAEESLRILTQRYQEGAAGIVDLLQTELALTNARFNRLQARHDLILNENALCLAVGHLYTRWLEPANCPIPQDNFNPIPKN